MTCEIYLKNSVSDRDRRRTTVSEAPSPREKEISQGGEEENVEEAIVCTLGSNVNWSLTFPPDHPVLSL